MKTKLKRKAASTFPVMTFNYVGYTRSRRSMEVLVCFSVVSQLKTK